MFKRKSVLTVLIVGIIVVFSAIGIANEKMVNETFVDTDLRDALNTIAYDANVNIFLDQTVEGITTCEFNDTPLEKVLNKLLAPYGYTWKKIGPNDYLIGTASPESLSFGELSQTEVIKLDYALAKEVANSLSDFFKPYIKISNLRNTITITSSPGIIERVKKDIRKFDVQKKQIEIQLFASEVSEKSFREFGLGSFEGTWGDGLEETGKVWGIDIGPVTFGASYRNDSIIALNLRALYERGEAKITGSPKIRVLEGYEAYIKLGEERHILSVLEREAGLYYAYTEKEEVTAESGLMAKVDRVTSNDEIVFEFVQMNLEEILESVQQIRSGEIIRVNKREARTSLILKNYETICIGSMTVEREKKLKRFPPYTTGETELIRLDLYMTASVIGTPPPPEYEGLERFTEKFKVEAPKQKKGFFAFFAKHPILTLLIVGGIAVATSQ